MVYKVCVKCNINKSLEEFQRHSISPDGFQYSCKVCRNLQKKLYRQLKKDEINKKQKEYTIKNKDKIVARSKIYYINNKEKIKQKVEVKKDIIKKKQQEYYLKNKEVFSQKAKQSRENFKKVYGISQTTFYKRRSPVDKAIQNLRRRLHKVLNSKSFNKNNKFKYILGCSPEELKSYLEAKFQPGMSWDNHSFEGWHIDHIIPLSSANSEEEVYKLCHYTNLQPLWKLENLQKSNKILVNING